MRVFVLPAALVSEATACASSDVRACSNANGTSTSEEDEAPCPKLSKMDACFIRLNKRSSSSETHQQPAVEMQLENFLRDESQQHKNENTSKYPALKSLAMRVLCVCATSALWNECLAREASLFGHTETDSHQQKFKL